MALNNLLYIGLMLLLVILCIYNIYISRRLFILYLKICLIEDNYNSAGLPAILKQVDVMIYEDLAKKYFNYYLTFSFIGCFKKRNLNLGVEYSTYYKDYSRKRMVFLLVSFVSLLILIFFIYLLISLGVQRL